MRASLSFCESLPSPFVRVTTILVSLNGCYWIPTTLCYKISTSLPFGSQFVGAINSPQPPANFEICPITTPPKSRFLNFPNYSLPQEAGNYHIPLLIAILFTQVFKSFLHLSVYKQLEVSYWVQHQLRGNTPPYSAASNIIPPTQMTSTGADELVVQLEESLGLSNLEHGPKLVGAVIADKMPNRGAIKNILKAAWRQYGEAKFIWEKDNLFSITVQDEDMANKILDNGP